MVVMSLDDPSVYVPVAVNCWDWPRSIAGDDGAMAIETSAAGLTVRLALPEIEPDTAMMVVAPGKNDCARPAVPGDMLIVAALGFDDVHCTEAVRSCVEVSLYVPVAVNCCVVPKGIEAVEGETAIETRTAELT